MHVEAWCELGIVIQMGNDFSEDSSNPVSAFFLSFTDLAALSGT